MNQKNPFLLLRWLSQVFCFGDKKLLQKFFYLKALEQFRVQVTLQLLVIAVITWNEMRIWEGTSQFRLRYYKVMSLMVAMLVYSGRQVWLEKEGGTWQVGGMVVQMA